MKKTIRERIDSYIKDKYDIDPEILPFVHPCHGFQPIDSGGLGSVFSSGNKDNCFMAH